MRLLLVALVAAVVFAFAVIGALRTPRLMIGVVLLAVAVEGVRSSAMTLSVTLSGLTVGIMDVLLVALGVVGLARVTSARIQKGVKTAAVVLSALVLLGTVSWVLAVGVQAGINQWRPWLTSVAFFWWSASAFRGTTIAALRVVVVVGWIAALLYSIGFFVWGTAMATSTTEFRAGNASVALMILVAMWVALIDEQVPLRGASVLIFLAVILLAAHRSVWVCALASGAVWATWQVARAGKVGLSRTVGPLLASGVLLSAAVVVALSSDDLSQSASDTRTFEYRQEVWSTLLGIPRSGLEWLVGATFGPTEVTTTTAVSVSAHSMYVEAIDMIGIVGFVAVVVLAAGLAWRPGRSPITPLPILMMVLALAWAFTYQWPPWLLIMIGVCSVRSKAGVPPRRGEIVEENDHCRRRQVAVVS